MLTSKIMRPKFIIILLGIVAFLFIVSYLLLKGPYFDWRPNILGSIRKEYCTFLGGEMRTVGCGIAGCYSNCKFVYKDGDKPCQSSKECSGKCIVTKPHIVSEQDSPELKKCKKENDKLYDCSAQNFQAQCQKWPQGNCDIIWEYDKGVIRLIFGDCTM